MARADELTDEVKKILKSSLIERNGTVVPTTTDVALSGGAVKITAAFLYADLAGSSVLAKLCPWSTTAKIIRAYLDICSRLIKANGGEIRSFDEDRVMGIFKSDTPNTQAVKCARQIDWMVTNVLNPEATRQFKSIENNNIQIKHCVGVDYSDVVAVRAGIRNNNDLIWIGRAPSFAAKLSDERSYPFEVFISHESYKKGVGDANNDGIWFKDTIEYAGETEVIYRTKTPLKP